MGTINVDWTDVDLSKYQRREGISGVEFKIDFKIRIDFRADEGVLRCFCVADGKTIGASTISFSDFAGY